MKKDMEGIRFVLRLAAPLAYFLALAALCALCGGCACHRGTAAVERVRDSLAARSSHTHVAARWLELRDSVAVRDS